MYGVSVVYVCIFVVLSGLVLVDAGCISLVHSALQLCAKAI